MWDRLQALIEEFQNLNLEKVVDYEKFSMISIVWHSTKIEGCSLTETETRVLLEEDITAGGKPLQDHLMVKDHYRALINLKQVAFRKLKFSPEFIKTVNSDVMKQTGGIIRTALGDFNSADGDFRLVQVFVDKKYFPNYQKVPRMVEEYCKVVNEKIDKVEEMDIVKLAADVHYNLVNIHPFADGNGRTSRLLMNYILLYHNLPLLKIFTEDRVAYIDALNQTEAEEDLEIFRKFIGEQYSKYLQLEIDKFKSKKRFTMMF
ncbi:MAG: Fic family protein [Bacteroidetes bacterium]|nr:MAG: Fic family protein [Bacteroidota bacterium]